MKYSKRKKGENRKESKLESWKGCNTRKVISASTVWWILGIAMAHLNVPDTSKSVCKTLRKIHTEIGPSVCK